MNLRLTILPLALFLTSCGGDDEQSYNEKVHQHILEYKEKWDFASLIDYSFTYRQSPGDCPTADEVPAIDINVENGMVSSVYLSGTSISVDISRGVTINQIFTLVTKLAQEKSIQFSSSAKVKTLPLFDDNLGYPVSFYFDKSNSDCDALFNRISNFS
tara:strand:- start:180 stop:653 length:474 start_codon:yes stop_codon:yes gene_type:complete